MQELYGNPGKHTIRFASSELDLKDIIQKMSRSVRPGTAQIFDPSYIMSELQLSSAYLNAEVSFNDKTNISKSKGMEMLLLVAMTGKIDEAIAKAGAKTNNRFVLFCDSKRTYSSVSRFLSKSSKFSITAKRRKQVLSRLGVRSGDEMDLLEMMAVARLSD